MLDQLVLADHAVGIASEVTKKIENLRLDMDRTPGASKLAPAGIQCKIIKYYQHLMSDCGYPKDPPGGSLKEMTGESKAKNRRI
jgi:hypothetical protein